MVNLSRGQSGPGDVTSWSNLSSFPLAHATVLARPTRFLCNQAMLVLRHTVIPAPISPDKLHAVGIRLRPGLDFLLCRHEPTCGCATRSGAYIAPHMAQSRTFPATDPQSR